MPKPIVLRNVLRADQFAEEEMRGRLAARGTTIVSVGGHPGAGRTSLIALTARHLVGRLDAAVVVASLRGADDAEEIAACGWPTVSVEVGRHGLLDAAMLGQALAALGEESPKLVLVEHVGNLLGPTPSLGEQARVMVVGVSAGHRLPQRYEFAFAECDAVVLNKTDLIPLMNFHLAQFDRALRATNPYAELIPLSCHTEEGVEPWLRWVELRVSEFGVSG